MSDVKIHHDRYSQLTDHIGDCIILINAHSVLTIMKWPTNKEALGIFEPTSLSHGIECSSYRKHIQITALQEPDKAIFLITFKEFIHLIKSGTKLNQKDIYTSTYKTSRHLSLLCSLYICILLIVAIYYFLSCIIWKQWINFWDFLLRSILIHLRLMSLHFPEIITSNLCDFSSKQLYRIFI